MYVTFGALPEPGKLRSPDSFIITYKYDPSHNSAIMGNITGFATALVNLFGLFRTPIHDVIVVGYVWYLCTCMATGTI